MFTRFLKILLVFVIFLGGEGAPGSEMGPQAPGWGPQIQRRRPQLIFQSLVFENVFKDFYVQAQCLLMFMIIFYFFVDFEGRDLSKNMRLEKTSLGIQLLSKMVV